MRAGEDELAAQPSTLRAVQPGCWYRWRQALREHSETARTHSSRSATARRSPTRSPAARLLVLDDIGTALRDAAADEVTAAMLAL